MVWWNDPSAVESEEVFRAEGLGPGWVDVLVNGTFTGSTMELAKPASAGLYYLRVQVGSSNDAFVK